MTINCFSSFFTKVTNAFCCRSTCCHRQKKEIPSDPKISAISSDLGLGTFATVDIKVSTELKEKFKATQKSPSTLPTSLPLPISTIPKPIVSPPDHWNGMQAFNSYESTSYINIAKFHNKEKFNYLNQIFDNLEVQLRRTENELFDVTSFYIVKSYFIFMYCGESTQKYRAFQHIHYSFRISKVTPYFNECLKTFSQQIINDIADNLAHLFFKDKDDNVNNHYAVITRIIDCSNHASQHLLQAALILGNVNVLRRCLLAKPNLNPYAVNKDGEPFIDVVDPKILEPFIKEGLLNKQKVDEVLIPLILRRQREKQYEDLHHVQHPHLLGRRNYTEEHFEMFKTGYEKRNFGRIPIHGFLPLEKTLVTLKSDPNFFYNANWVSVLTEPAIASEAPIAAEEGLLSKESEPAFWQMVWGTRRKMIVMLTNVSNKNQCSEYFLPKKYGDLTVESVTELSKEETSPNEFILKRLIKLSDGKEVREIYHYQIVNWPDMNVVNPSTLAKLIQEMEKEKFPENEGGILTHCQAGVGRTGTFLAIYGAYLQIKKNQQLGKKSDLDEIVVKIANQLREERNHSIQTSLQYLLIFETLKKLLIVDLNVKPEQKEEKKG